jgi:hypothetical protein
MTNIFVHHPNGNDGLKSLPVVAGKSVADVIAIVRQPVQVEEKVAVEKDEKVTFSQALAMLVEPIVTRKITF